MDEANQKISEKLSTCNLVLFQSGENNQKVLLVSKMHYYPIINVNM